MHSFIDLLRNEILISSVISWAVAQILKTILHMIVTKQFVAERLVGTGGMPSSHSATVCGLATAVGINEGLGSTYFAIAIIVAIVVMYDALGVRRETGKQALVINEIIAHFKSMGKDISAQQVLKVFVGHTPLQVLAGAILGIVVAFCITYVM